MVIKKDGHKTDMNLGSILKTSFFNHLNPPRVSHDSLRIVTTFGLGIISFSLFIILTITGIMLMFYYIPSLEIAYNNVTDLDQIVPFGRLIRNMHRWAGHAMVVTVSLHLVRIYLTSAFFHQRRLNWQIGIALFALTFLLAFTGYLLPWDQLGYWAGVIGVNFFRQLPLVGGLMNDGQIGQTTLIYFYTFHVVFLPLLATILIAIHFWRIRKDGGLAKSGQTKELSPSWPLLIKYQLVGLLTTLAIVWLISLLFNAPIHGLPDPLHPSNPSKAAWYLVGVQEMVSYSTTMGGMVIPGTIMFFLILVPFIDLPVKTAGNWPTAKTDILIMGTASLLTIILTLSITVLNNIYLPAWNSSLSNIVNPVVMLLFLWPTLFGITYILSRNRHLALTAVFISMVTSQLSFIILGYFFRGIDWKFIF